MIVKSIRSLLAWNSITTAALVGGIVLLLCGLLVYGFVPRHDGGVPAGHFASAMSQASSNPQSDAKAELVTVCQLIHDPGKYNQKVVQVTGFFSHGFEDSGLFDPSCDSRFGIWYEYGGTNATGTMYCCGVTATRTRNQPVVVENIPIPLKADDQFRSLDQLLHGPRDSIVHATVIGRFFSGKKGKGADGRDWWQGYGQMGCCSLFMVQQVVSVDPHDRSDLDYGASADQPDISQSGCGYRFLLDFDSFKQYAEAQQQAESGERAWAFDDPDRVAKDDLARLLKLNENSIQDLKVIRQSQGRMVYKWKRKETKATYMVVVSKPYILSFYTKTKAVAWVTIAAYESSCGPGNSVTRLK